MSITTVAYNILVLFVLDPFLCNVLINVLPLYNDTVCDLVQTEMKYGGTDFNKGHV